VQLEKSVIPDSATVFQKLNFLLKDGRNKNFKEIDSQFTGISTTKALKMDKTVPVGFNMNSLVEKSS